MLPLGVEGDRGGARTSGRAEGARSLALAVVLVAVAAGVAMAVGEREVVIAGLRDAGVLNELALRAVRALGQFSAAGTIGTLLLLTVLVRATDVGSQTVLTRLPRMLSGWATVWCLASAALLVITCAEIVGVDVAELIRSGALPDVVQAVPSIRALLPTVAVSFLVAVWAARATLPTVAWPLLAFSLAVLIPPLFTSHAGHDAAGGFLALASLIVHVPAVALWFGGLLVLVVHLPRRSPLLRVAVPRFSGLAGWCFPMVALSGALAAYSRIPDWQQLVTTPYGRLVVAKSLVLVVLGLCGAVHRGRTLPAVAAGRPWSFARLATAELALMAAVLGLAAALATTSPPG
jgi:putative copper export protein